MSDPFTDEEYTDKRVAEVLAEMTGRPVEDFELSEDYDFPALDELESVPIDGGDSDE